MRLFFKWIESVINCMVLLFSPEPQKKPVPVKVEKKPARDLRGRF